jgi:DNA-binding transcriptional ArsR family regulator
MKKSEALTVDAFLDSKVAVAVLRTLIQRDMPLPISRIAKEIGSNYVTVRKHVRYLEEADLVTSVDYGKRRLYRANAANERISVFKRFIEDWNRGTEKHKGRVAYCKEP